MTRHARRFTQVLVLTMAVVCSAWTAHAQSRGPSAIRRAIDAGTYARAETLAVQLAASLSVTSQSDPLPLLRAQDLLVEALVKNGKGAPAATFHLARGLVRTKERRLGRVHLETSHSLLNLALVRTARGEFEEAISLLNRVIFIRRASRDVDTRLVADALDQLVFVLIQLEQFPRAKQRLDESIRIRNAHAASDEIGVSRTLELLGTWYRYAGPYGDAMAPLDRALAIRTRLTPQHPETASILQLRGDVLFLRGDSAGAQQVWADALRMAERTLGPRHPAIAEYLRRLGFAAFAAGNLADARRLRERALRVGEQALAPCDPALTRLMNSLANSFQYDGEFFEARRLYARALTTIEKCLGKNHSEYATYIFNDAAMAREIGDLGEADALLERAIAIWSRVLGPNHAYVARGLDALAEVAALRGQLDRARTIYERALAIHRRELGPDHPQVAWMLTNLARTLAEQGDTAGAIRQIEQAVAIFRKSGSPDDADHVARVMELRGTLQMQTGQVSDARRSVAEALAARERVFGRAHPLTAATRATLAAIDLARGQRDTALAAALEAEQAGRDHLRFTVRYLPERQAMAYAAKRPRGLDLALSVAAAVPNDVSRVFDSVIRSRGVVLDELAARRLASYGSTAQDTGVAAAIAARQRFANLVVRSLIEPVPRPLLEGARQQKEDAERLLAERTVEGRVELARASSGLDEVKRALPRDTVLVSFVRYDRTVVSGIGSSAQTTVVPSYGAFVIRGGATGVAFAPLGPASSIEMLVSEWRTAASGDAAAAGLATRDRIEALYMTAAGRLRSAVWDPIEAEVGDARQIFVVPDGTLNLVNLAALTDRQGRYFVERDAVIHYLSTERDVVVSSVESKSRGGLLAVGNPAFDEGRPPSRAQPATTRSVCEPAGPARFGNLPGSLGEVNEISQLWPRSDSSVATVLSGSSASETAVKKALAGRRVLHFATHGFFIGDTCPPDGSRSGGVARSSAAARFAEEGRENPLLMSGLAFAGANRRGAARLDEDDGILTAEEVAGLNLNGVEWAVLSACDTGLGEIRAGEGVFGLRRAFQVAGARTVIMSLWPVDDQATRAWMRALYEARLRRGLSTADAVHSASATVLRDRRAKKQSTLPVYWAAFVAAGDWK